MQQSIFLWKKGCRRNMDLLLSPSNLQKMLNNKKLRNITRRPNLLMNSCRFLNSQFPNQVNNSPHTINNSFINKRPNNHHLNNRNINKNRNRVFDWIGSSMKQLIATNQRRTKMLIRRKCLITWKWKSMNFLINLKERISNFFITCIITPQNLGKPEYHPVKDQNRNRSLLKFLQPRKFLLTRPSKDQTGNLVRIVRQKCTKTSYKRKGYSERRRKSG